MGNKESAATEAVRLGVGPLATGASTPASVGYKTLAAVAAYAQGLMVSPLTRNKWSWRHGICSSVLLALVRPNATTMRMRTSSMTKWKPSPLLWANDTGLGRTLAVGMGLLGGRVALLVQRPTTGLGAVIRVLREVEALLGTAVLLLPLIVAVWMLW